jgi:hypothetical protein
MTADKKIQELHDTYVKVSGMDVALRFNRESSWMEFVRAGFTNADLAAVLGRLRAMVATGDRRPECLKFSNVVEGLDRFEEELAMIKSQLNGVEPGERPLSVMEMYRVIESKQRIVDELERRYANEDAFGLSWSNQEFREEAATLRKQIRVLHYRIAKVA